jgi:hypothetical protein
MLTPVCWTHQSANQLLWCVTRFDSAFSVLLRLDCGKTTVFRFRFQELNGVGVRSLKGPTPAISPMLEEDLVSVGMCDSAPSSRPQSPTRLGVPASPVRLHEAARAAG